MASFAVEHEKAKAYDQLAELAVTTKTKTLRAETDKDRAAIVNDFFLRSVMIMRIAGTRMMTADSSASHTRFAKAPQGSSLSTAGVVRGRSG